MISQTSQTFAVNIPSAYHPAPAFAVRSFGKIQKLTETDTREVLNFLRERPVHTVVMTSMIHDNGFDSPQNRGEFYGYRNDSGKLEGVALIGHTTLVEARSKKSLRALAVEARQSKTPVHLMMSDGNSIESFWKIYADETEQPRLVCSEKLFELRKSVIAQKSSGELRLAAAKELLPIAEAHAAVAFDECGVNPLEKDREAFLKRVARRIEQGRIWVVFDADGELVFKADIAAETSEVSYLEGIYVAPGRRGNGIGGKYLSELSGVLLEQAKFVCLLSNEKFEKAHRAYLKSGFKSNGCCVTIFT